MSNRLRHPRTARTRLPWPWLDRGGRFSTLKLSLLIGLLAPGAVLLAMLADGAMGAEPWKAATREAGSHAVHILLLSLAVTPLRYVADWPKAATLRRMVGLAALGYGLLHLVLYTGHLAWDLLAVGAEIATRFYLTLGFVVLVGLVVLGCTSTDRSQARMGPRWKKLHRWVYLLAAGAVFHAFLQSKARADSAVLVAGIYLWLMAWRQLPGRWRAHPPALAALAVAAGLGAALVEYAWYALATKLPAGRILEANLGFDAGVRPAQWVVLAGLGVAVLPWLRRIGRRATA
jgi:sulfoxide reductase heme-binding subunit YedZ